MNKIHIFIYVSCCVKTREHEHTRKNPTSDQRSTRLKVNLLKDLNAMLYIL